MRKFLISAALISAAAVSAPAAAQWGYPQAQNNFGYNRGTTQAIQNEVRQLQQRIERMYQRRLISNGERRSLHERAENINRRLFEYSRNGLSQREYFDLQQRIQNLRERVQRERAEGRDDRRDDRGDRRGRGSDRWDD